MTESQKKFLKQYIGKDWLDTDFTNAQDKQDLLEALMAKEEFNDFLYSEFQKTLHVVSDLILLSPEETAELICRWKGR